MCLHHAHSTATTGQCWFFWERFQKKIHCHYIQAKSIGIGLSGGCSPKTYDVNRLGGQCRFRKYLPNFAIEQFHQKVSVFNSLKSADKLIEIFHIRLTWFSPPRPLMGPFKWGMKWYIWLHPWNEPATNMSLLWPNVNKLGKKLVTFREIFFMFITKTLKKKGI